MLLVFRICEKKSQFKNFTLKVLGAVLTCNRAVFSCRFLSTLFEYYNTTKSIYRWAVIKLFILKYIHSAIKYYFPIFVPKVYLAGIFFSKFESHTCLLSIFHWDNIKKATPKMYAII